MRGSEFIVRLPLIAVDSRAELPAVESRDTGMLTPQRILVVDDNRDSADSLGGLLRLLGADTHVAYSGREALEALPIFRPSVVVLDIGMPVMDGYEVSRRIRQHAEFQDVTLVALTGWGQEEDRRRSRAAGFDHHLVKPVDVEVLQTVLMSVERRAKSRSG